MGAMADLLHAHTATLDPRPARRPQRMRVLAILNVQGKAGADAGPERIHQTAADAFAAAGVDATIELVGGAELSPAVQTALGSRASGDRFAFDALVVGGGDGTISTAAGHLAGTGIPLGVLPLGTLNHFAKDLGIPSVTDAAALVIAQGYARDIDASEVNGRIFINNSSIGIYPYMVEAREERRRMLGLGKWWAMVLAFGWMLRRFPVHRLYIRTSGQTRPRKTPCVFVGNNAYALDSTALGRREALDRGELCLYIARTGSRLTLLWLMVKTAFGLLKPARDFELVRTAAIEINSRSPRLRVAADGELEKMKPPLRYRIRARALRVIVPPLAKP
jgi:diacylglycerol kinase family enzyme